MKGEGGGRAEEGAGEKDAKASNLEQGWNFTWNGQAGLGHPPRERGGGMAGRDVGLQGGVEGVLSEFQTP